MGKGDDILIRRARSEDAGGVARVHVQTWRTTYVGQVPDEHLARLSVEKRQAYWLKTISEDAGDGEFVFVADRGEEVIGFASGGRERSGDPTYTGEIYAIYVLDSCQGLGVGRRLVEAVATALLQRNLNSMLVWTLERNGARTFYERLGGKYVRSGVYDCGGTPLVQVAYGWNDLENAFGPSRE